MSVKFNLSLNANRHSYEYNGVVNKCRKLLEDTCGDADSVLDQLASGNFATVIMRDDQYGRFMCLRRIRNLGNRVRHYGEPQYIPDDRQTQLVFDLRKAA